MMVFINVIQTRKPSLLSAVTGLLFFTLLILPLPRSYIFDSTIEKQKSEEPGINLSLSNEMQKNDKTDETAWVETISKSPSLRENHTFPLNFTAQSILSDAHVRRHNQIIEIDSVRPLFFKDGLQKICSKKSEDRDFITPVKGKRKSWRPINHMFKCLTVSEDGTSATFTTLNLSSLPSLMETGDAILFGAGIDRQTWDINWFFGRLMNRLIELRNALSHSASCGKLIILPRTLSTSDSESWGEFDCADFRRIGRHPNTNDGSVASTGRDDGIMPQVLHQNKTETMQRNACSLVSPEDNRFWFLYVPRRLDFIPDFKIRSNAAHIIFLAWWGLGPGYFRCTACSQSDLNLTIAWARSGDVFRRTDPDRSYGQPPVDYYLQAMKHSGARDVLFLSKDGIRGSRMRDSNPLLSEPTEFGFGNQSDSDRRFNITLVLDEPFHKVLHQLFCARNAIIGVSTLSTILTFSPNAKTIFLAKPWIYSQALEYGTADIYFYDVGLSDSLGMEFENNTFHRKTGLTNYSVYQNWTNSAEQRQEMVSFRGGTLEPILLQNPRKTSI